MATEQITDAERLKVLEMVRTRGMRGAAQALQLDKETVLRLLTPLAVRRQTAHWLRSRLQDARI